jgi:DNA mismatch repair protein MutS2
MDERTLRTLEWSKILERLSERASTRMGKERAESLLPSTSYLEVVEWQAETSEARRILGAGRSFPLGGLHDLRPYIKRAVIGGVLEPNELLDVADTISSARRLHKFLLEVEEEIPHLLALANLIHAPGHLEAEIRSAITDAGEVADDASPLLSQIRRAQRTYQARIKEKLDSYVRGPGAKYLQEQIITIRDDRYVIPVKIEYRAQVPGIVHDQSQSGSTLFIEPMAIVEMNNELKELALKERQEIARILQRLSTLFAAEGEALLRTLDAVGQIDFAVAKGKLSQDLDCTAPEIDEEPLLQIKRGRHPLLGKTAVPSDVHLGVSFDTLVITGPNTGGKTVTLKMMGLFVLMAQAGLHLPAAFGTRMGIFDQVFTDVGDEQSIEQSLSTFSSHMTNIVRILNEIEGKALVLVDELGAGTDPNEGAALAMSILEHLHARGAKTVATTHYSELKSFAYARPRVENASVEFDVETLRPTYRLLIGVPGSSNAFEISRRLGLSPVIVERARRFLTKDQERVEDMIAQIHATKAELEREKEEAIRLRAEAQRLKAEYERRFGGAEQRAAEIVEKAKLQAQQLLTAARRESEAIIEELKAARKAQREAERMGAIQAARGRLKAAREAIAPQEDRTRRRGAVPTGLKPGDTVRILSLGQTGQVLAEPDGAGNVIVQAGILRVTVPLTDLERAEAPAQEAKPRATASGRSLAAAKAKTVSTEVDLRGLLVEEGIEKLDKFLDDAILGGVPQIRIIHGKGTGALRKAVTEYLKTHPQIASYRLGGAGEGGDGVTVATIRD